MLQTRTASLMLVAVWSVSLLSTDLIDSPLSSVLAGRPASNALQSIPASEFLQTLWATVSQELPLQPITRSALLQPRTSSAAALTDNSTFSACLSKKIRHLRPGRLGNNMCHTAESGYEALIWQVAQRGFAYLQSSLVAAGWQAMHRRPAQHACG